MATMTKGTIINREGYVVRLADYKDHDHIVSFLTKEGLISFRSSGSKKPSNKNSRSMALLVKSKVSLKENENYLSLKESMVLSYPDASDDFAKSASLMLIAEIASRMIQEDEGEETFLWLDKTMASIDKGFDPLTSALIFLAQILRIAGYGLNVDSCVFCGGKKDIVGISYDNGGFVCRKDIESERQRKDPQTLKIIRYIFRLAPDSFDKVPFGKKETKNLIKELSNNLSEYSGIKLRSIELIDKI